MNRKQKKINVCVFVGFVGARLEKKQREQVAIVKRKLTQKKKSIDYEEGQTSSKSRGSKGQWQMRTKKIYWNTYTHAHERFVCFCFNAWAVKRLEYSRKRRKLNFSMSTD